MRKLNRILRSLRSRAAAKIKPSPLPTYFGIFESFASAMQAERLCAYESAAHQEWLEAQLASKLQRLQQKLPPEWGSDTARLSQLPLLLASLAQPGKKIKILDVGGGAGDGLLECLYSLRAKDFAYYLFELPAASQVAQMLLGQRPEFHSVNKIESSAPYDVIFLGSSLPYFADYASLLRQLFAACRDSLLVADTACGDFSSIVTRQVNLADRELICWLFGVEDLRKIAEECGFQLVAETACFTPDHGFENFPMPYQQAIYKNLLFRRV